MSKSDSLQPLDLGQTLPEKQFSWIHLVQGGGDYANSVQELLSNFPLTYGDFRDGFMRQGVEFRPEGFAFMVTIPTSSEDDPFEQIGLFVLPHQVISLCHSAQPLFQELTTHWLAKPKDLGDNSSRLLYTILDACIDRYFPEVDSIHERIDDIEDMMFNSHPTHPTEILAIKRELLIARKNIVPIRENVTSLLRLAQQISHQRDIPEYQDLYNHCLRVSENIDLGREMVSSLLDVQYTISGHKLNEVMRILTVISTILMTSALIAGIYGMNFVHMPELRWPLGYLFAIGLMILSGVGILVWFKKAGFFDGKLKVK
ncbi:MAG: magnesium transporter CorA family protein [Fimbriimonadaceae bacterium]